MAASIAMGTSQARDVEGCRVISTKATRAHPGLARCGRRPSGPPRAPHGRFVMQPDVTATSKSEAPRPKPTNGEHAPSPGAHAPSPELVIGALGVVFGDVGTSPLYAVRECVS